MGKSCGDDGCGGVCGSCGPAGSCQVDQTCDYDLSCEDILSKDPTAPTGPYTVDPDGAGSAEAKGVYCDMSGPVVTYEDVAVGQYNASYAGYELLSLADLQDSFIQEVFTWAYNAQGGLTNLMVGIKPGNCCFKEGTPGKYIAFGAGGRLFPCEGETPLCNDPLNDAVVGFRAGFSSACETELSADYFATKAPLIESGCDDANNPGFFLKKSVAVCTPLCDGLACGDDGCGGLCGTCTGQDICEDGQCVCQPSCSGKVCGDDGCGGLCGTCASNESCEEGGEVCVCQPSCSGKTCGSDGCGGSCGSCSGQDSCVSGQCVCQPSCSGKTCGNDGCGGSCGSCSGQDSCVSGQCVCQPSCSGKVCGPDGCGGVCGTCASNESCEEGGEVCVCQPSCSGKVCGPDGCGGVCGTCASNESCEEGGEVCVCQPSCSGKVCGPDGCGGVCGTCSGNATCEEGGEVCVCQPDCTGKVCGGDGCGGSCGTCASDLVCSANQTMCECYDPVCPPLNTTEGLIEDAMAGDSYCISDDQYKQCVDPGNGQCPEWTWSLTCNWDDGLCIQYGSNHDCGLE